MTFPVVPEQRARTSPGARAAARCAVLAARLLIRLPPARLRRVLRAASRRAGPATQDQALRARQAVVAVSRACAGQGCLQRSVATALLCRARGSWPDWCTGVRTQPFRAHAWVEVDGQPVGEGHDITLFHKLMHIPAPGGAQVPAETHAVGPPAGPVAPAVPISRAAPAEPAASEPAATTEPAPPTVPTASAAPETPTAPTAKDAPTSPATPARRSAS